MAKTPVQRYNDAAQGMSAADRAWADFCADIPVATSRVVLARDGAWVFTRLRDGSVVRTAVHDQMDVTKL